MKMSVFVSQLALLCVCEGWYDRKLCCAFGKWCSKMVHFSSL